MKIGKLKQILNQYEDDKEVIFAYKSEMVAFGGAKGSRCEEIMIYIDKYDYLNICEDSWRQEDYINDVLFQKNRGGEILVDKFNIEKG